MRLDIIHNEDCMVGLRRLPDACVDLIVTDPPYGISYISHMSTDVAYKERVMHTEWDRDFDFTDYHKELYRVLKDDSFMYVWGSFENYETMRAVGMDRVLVWDKGVIGMGDLKDWGIGFELVYVFKKGRPKLRGKRVSGVFRISQRKNRRHVPGFFGKTLHPTQKPVSVMRYLIEKSSDIGDIVLDAFMGSGTTALACKQTKRHYIGYEVEPSYCRIAENRLKQTLMEAFT